MSEKNIQKIITRANSLIGKPYKYGATLEEAPNYFDCASFIRFLFKQINIELGYTGIQQASDKKGIEIIPNSNFSNLERGDLIFTRGRKGRYDDDLFEGRKIYIGHVALYIGNHEIIHARRRFGGIIKQSLNDILLDPDLSITIIKRF